MSSNRVLRAYAPASIGNFAAGFDILGAALAPLDGSLLGDVVRVEASDKDSFSLKGPFGPRLKKESRQNLVLRSRDLFREALTAKGLESHPLALVLEKQLPLSSGLGSSGSSIVATLVALQAHHGEPLSRTELLDLAARAEGTYSGMPIMDNVASSLLGGLQMVVPGTAGASLRGLPWPEDLILVVVHPAMELSTAQSRSALPTVMGVDSAVEFGSNLAAFVHALHTHDRRLLARTLRDVLAEPHRASLVPGFAEAQRTALAEGALGCSLSGSGPSMFAVAESEAAATRIQAGLQQTLKGAGHESQAWLCGLDLEGARVLA